MEMQTQVHPAKLNYLKTNKKLFNPTPHGHSRHLAVQLVDKKVALL